MKKRFASLLGMGAGLGLALAATAASADGYRPGGLKGPDLCCESWKGFYIGAHGGYAWKDDEFTDLIFAAVGGLPNEFMTGIDAQGGLWGFQTGYNWQRGGLVGGLEVDFSSTYIEGSTTQVRDFNAIGVDLRQSFTRTDDVKYLGSVRGRLGVTQFGAGCCSNFLVYGTAGLAWEKVHQSLSITNSSAAGVVSQTVTTPADRFGWVAGVGAEAKIGGSNWIARIEYLHYDFDAQFTATSQSGTVAGLNTFSEDPGRQTIDVVRGAISYKF